MKAFILAAGRGQRMRHLTEHCPKPLLRVGQYTLLEWQIRRLARAGFSDIVINLGYRGQDIVAALGDGGALGVKITYSVEGNPALETAGGLIHALPLLGDAPFILVNADVWCDVDFAQFAMRYRAQDDAHLLLVPTPIWKACGDFSLSGDRVVAGDTLTYAGIACLHPRLFAGYPAGRRPLAPVFAAAMTQGRVSGEYYSGMWQDVGTPERLQVLQALYAT